MIGKYLDTLKALINPALGVTPEAEIMRITLDFIATGTSPELQHLLDLATADGDSEAIDFFTKILADGATEGPDEQLHAPGNPGEIIFNIDDLFGSNPNFIYDKTHGSIQIKALADNGPSAGYFDYDVGGNLSQLATIFNFHDSGNGGGLSGTTDGAGNWTFTLSGGPTSFDGNLVQNVQDPTNPQDAATKNYVDTHAGGGGGSVPGGSNMQVQYNDNGFFNGASGFTFNNVTGDVVVPGNFTVGFGSTQSLPHGSSFGGGEANTITGENSFAYGVLNTIAGTACGAIGLQNIAPANFSFVAGRYNNSSGQDSIALGIHNTTNGDGAVALGTSNTASGNSSIALANNTTANADAQTVVGHYNIPIGTPGSSAPTDEIFTVGNGTSGSPSTAFAILRSGDLQVVGSSGIVGQVLTSGGPGVAPHWSSAGGVTAALDNLASTAVNTDIIPASGVHPNLGAFSNGNDNFSWGTIYTKQIYSESFTMSGDFPANNDNLLMYSNSDINGEPNADVVIQNTGNPGFTANSTGILIGTGSNNGVNTQDLYFATGLPSAGFNSGNMFFRPAGVSGSGVQGFIQMFDTVQAINNYSTYSYGNTGVLLGANSDLDQSNLQVYFGSTDTTGANNSSNVVFTTGSILGAASTGIPGWMTFNAGSVVDGNQGGGSIEMYAGNGTTNYGGHVLSAAGNSSAGGAGGNNTIRAGTGAINGYIALDSQGGVIVPDLSGTPSNPPSGWTKLYTKASDGKLYRLTSSGVETQIG